MINLKIVYNRVHEANKLFCRVYYSTPCFSVMTPNRCHRSRLRWFKRLRLFITLSTVNNDYFPFLHKISQVLLTCCALSA